MNACAPHKSGHVWEDNFAGHTLFRVPRSLLRGWGGVRSAYASEAKTASGQAWAT